MEHLLQVGFSITGFTIAVLLLKNENARQSYYAILLLLLWFIRFLALYLKMNVSLIDFPFLIVFDQNLLFLDGLLFYWYIRSLNNTQQLKTQVFQLLPFFLAFGLSIFTLYSVETSDLVNKYNEINTKRELKETETIGLNIFIFFLLVILINGFFVFKSIRLLRNYKILLTDNISTLHNLRASWLKKLTYFWLFFSFTPLVLFSINYVYRPIQIDIFENTLLLGLWLTSIFFSLNVITQKYINEKLLFKSSETSAQKESEQEIIQIFATLTEYMKNSEAFKDEKLSLHSLADQLNVKSSKLSIAINTKNKTNFYEYINSYRVEAVKRDLSNTTEQIIIIAYKNGFNSKSTFNTVFKKMTGMTPSQYRKTSNR